MQSETGFPSSHQLKSYVASKSRLKLATRCAVSGCWPSGIFLVPAYTCCPGKEAVKRLSVSVCLGVECLCSVCWRVHFIQAAWQSLDSGHRRLNVQP